MVSLAPRVSAARTAIPSMPDASKGGDERTAQIGPAVTRPAACSTGTRVAGTLAGQPAASRASRQAACARAAGTSRMNGLAVTGALFRTD